MEREKNEEMRDSTPLLEGHINYGLHTEMMLTDNEDEETKRLRKWNNREMREHKDWEIESQAKFVKKTEQYTAETNCVLQNCTGDANDT